MALRSNSKRLEIAGMLVDNFDEVPTAEMADSEPPTSIDSGRFVYDIIDAPDAYWGPSVWRMGSDHPDFMLQTSDIWSGEWSPDPQTSAYLGSDLIMRDKTFADAVVTAAFLVRRVNWFEDSDNDGIGLVFRFQDANNYYRLLSVIEGGPFTRLEKWVDGELTVLGFSDNPDHAYINQTGVLANDLNLLRVDKAGSRIRAYVNGEEVFDVTDSTFSSGRVGVSTYAQCWTWLDYITVEEN